MMLLKKILFWLIMSLSYFSLSTAHANLTLNLSKAGAGQGAVSGHSESYDYYSSPSGISVSCGATSTTCPSYTIESGSQVYLYSSPTSGSAFEKWTSTDNSHTCHNSTSTFCHFEMNQNPTNLTANFRLLAANRLSVIRAGEGNGTIQITSTVPNNANDIFGVAIKDTAPNSARNRLKELPNSNITIKLKAQADTTSSVFMGWTGCSNGPFNASGNPILANGNLNTNCHVTVTGAKTVTATFNKKEYKLTLKKAGNGSGTVTNYDYNSSGSGVGVINCAPPCTTAFAMYPAGEIAQLQAQAASGSKFGGWSNCPNSSSTLLSSNCYTNQILSPLTVKATFTKLSNRRLELSRTGTGTGGITNVMPATPAISCYGGTCIAEYSANTTVTLQANPTNGSVFDGWVGCNPIANSQPPRCTVSVNNSISSASNNFKKVIAKFKSVSYSLTVTPAGSGVVQDYDYNASGSGIMINCGSGNNTCNATLNSGTSITLSAQPTSGAQFIGWGGDGTCTGTEDTCYVLMNSTKHINANFTPAP